MPPIPWEFHTVEDPGANAWCFPGGTVLFLEGLMRSGLARTEDEVAALLGHEMAHAAARHMTERRSLAELRDAIAPLGRFFGPRLVELLADEDEVRRAVELQAGDFDRSQEIEADLIGLELMARAGYDPARAPAFWRRMIERAHGPTASSHPDHALRERELSRHVDVAAYVAERRASRLEDEPRSRWTWAETSSGARRARSLPTAGALTFGAHVPSRYLRASPLLLDVRATPLSGPRGSAPRARVTLTAARDLALDALRFDAALYLEREDDQTSRALLAIPIARSAELGSPKTEMRVVLPKLPSGPLRLRARVWVGALWTESSRRFEVTEEGVRLSP